MFRFRTALDQELLPALLVVTHLASHGLIPEGTHDGLLTISHRDHSTACLSQLLVAVGLVWRDRTADEVWQDVFYCFFSWPYKAVGIPESRWFVTLNVIWFAEEDGTRVCYWNSLINANICSYTNSRCFVAETNRVVSWTHCPQSARWWGRAPQLQLHVATTGQRSAGRCHCCFGLLCCYIAGWTLAWGDWSAFTSLPAFFFQSALIGFISWQPLYFLWIATKLLSCEFMGIYTERADRGSALKRAA